MTRLRHAGLVVTALFCIAGCLKLDLNFDDKGSGRYTLTHLATNIDELRRRNTSAVVTVEEANVKETIGTVRARFTDVLRLNTAEMFQDVVITIDPDEKGRRKFIARLNNNFAKKTPESVLKTLVEKNEKDAVITVTFPGEVAETNATKKDGRTATWIVPTKDIVYSPLIRFEATYAAPGAGG